MTPRPLGLFRKFIRFGSATLPSVTKVSREVLGQLIIIGDNKQEKNSKFAGSHSGRAVECNQG